MLELTQTTQYVATACFSLAILHTFLVKRFQTLAARYPQGSVGENFFHLLGEVEIVFGFWAGIFLAFLAGTEGKNQMREYMLSLNFTEPGFVFVILAVCSTRPILHAASALMDTLARLLPLPKPIAAYWVTLVAGPLLGSFITEPAAMTVTALILLDRFYSRGISSRLMYATLGLLFVNISIGGTLTPFAAPPVLMVAAKWNWDLSYMLANFGWKAVLAVVISTTFVTFRFRKELVRLDAEARPEARAPGGAKKLRVPFWVTLAHLGFLALIVVFAHDLVIFAGLFFFFLGLYTVTQEYQTELKLREGMLVMFFLGGLVMLGGPQRWWLEPLLTQLSTVPLYLGAAALTAFTDNAALTYLGAQVPTLAMEARYALVAGAVVGGGMTVIANAPNPAGFGILNRSFGETGISPGGLALSALSPTLIALAIFWPWG